MMPTNRHRLIYSSSTPIQVSDPASLVSGIGNPKILTGNNKVPKDNPFAITIDLPEYDPENLYPKTKDDKFITCSLLALATIYDSSDVGVVVAATKAAPGMPVNNPQRKHRVKMKRIVRHQTFHFPKKLQSERGFTFAASGNVVLFVYSLHKFYSGTSLVNKQTILQKILLPY